MIVDKKNFQGGKTKLIFENLIFHQKDFNDQNLIFQAFACWWNLHLNMSDCLNPFMPSGNKRSYILKQTCSIYTRILVRMTSGSTRHKRVKELVKQKVAKLKFVNWTSKNENIVERLWISRFLLL